MKKSLILLLILFISADYFAQSNQLLTAHGSLRGGQLDLAKVAVDEAITKSGLKEQAITWTLRGQIYQAIYSSKIEKYRKLDADPLSKSLFAYEKSQKLGGDFDGTKDSLRVLSYQFINKGVNEYKMQSTIWELCIITKPRMVKTGLQVLQRHYHI